jgi:hypothetical protein
MVGECLTISILSFESYWRMPRRRLTPNHLRTYHQKTADKQYLPTTSAHKLTFYSQVSIAAGGPFKSSFGLIVGRAVSPLLRWLRWALFIWQKQRRVVGGSSS